MRPHGHAPTPPSTADGARPASPVSAAARTARARSAAPGAPQRSSTALPIAAPRSATISDAWEPRSLGAHHLRPRRAASRGVSSASSGTDGEANGGFLPPHVLLERQAGGRGGRPLHVGSVLEGAGRKLTGVAAARFRVETLRQTGFLEPGSGGKGDGVAGAGAGA